MANFLHTLDSNNNILLKSFYQHKLLNNSFIHVIFYCYLFDYCIHYFQCQKLSDDQSDHTESETDLFEKYDNNLQPGPNKVSIISTTLFINF